MHINIVETCSAVLLRIYLIDYWLSNVLVTQLTGPHDKDISNTPQKGQSLYILLT